MQLGLGGRLLDHRHLGALALTRLEWRAGLLPRSLGYLDVQRRTGVAGVAHGRLLRLRRLGLGGARGGHERRWRVIPRPANAHPLLLAHNQLIVAQETEVQAILLRLTDEALDFVQRIGCLKTGHSRGLFLQGAKKDKL